MRSNTNNIAMRHLESNCGDPLWSRIVYRDKHWSADGKTLVSDVAECCGGVQETRRELEIAET